MNEFNNEEKDNIEETDQFKLIKAYFFAVIDNLKTYYRLLPACFLFIFVVGGFFYLRSPIIYSAQAIIGPPNPSPVYAMLSSMGDADSGVGGFAKRFLSSGNSASPFQKFQLLLNSNTLYINLAQKDHMLQTVFHGRWDAQHKRWKQGGPLHKVMASVKRGLGWPVQQGPDADTLQRALQKRMTIADANFGNNGSMASLMAAGSGYFQISLKDRSPQSAEHILQTILDRSDAIIRTELKKDVEARIRFLTREIPKITNQDQRETLISILSNQEKIKTFLVADKHFAYVIISKPYARQTPVSPRPPVAAAFRGIVMSVLLWIILATLTMKVSFLEKKLRIFRRC